MMRPYLSAGRTETGRVRRVNEDAILLADGPGLWVVADGLGGHTAGDFASQLVTCRLGALRFRGDLAGQIEAVEDEMNTVNRLLRDAARQHGVDIIASTVVVLVHAREMVACGWAGDSRGYCFDDDRLRQLTRDHVHDVGDDVTRIGDREARTMAGALTRAVGADEELHMDWVITRRHPGMGFVLCSDGINKELADSEIEAECRRHKAPSALVDGLVDSALSRGGRDNISAVAVWLDEFED
jgi:protein phosphatase